MPQPLQDSIRSALPPAPAILALGLSVVAVLPAAAQNAQYSGPGDQLDRSVDDRSQIETAVSEARWTFGGLKVDPWIGIKQASYVDNIFGSSVDQESDFTITVGAGLRAFLPLGSRVTAALYALPEYVWWNKLNERRRLNGQFGAGLYGYFSRMTLEAEAGRRDQQAVVTPESEQLTNSRNDQSRILLGVKLYRSVELYAEASVQEFDNLIDDEVDPRALPLGRLDRKEEIQRAGVRTRLGARGRLFVGVEDREVKFAEVSARDVKGTSPFLQLRFDAEPLFFETSLTQREAEPATESLPAIDELEATALISLSTFGERLRFSFYGRRVVVYSLSGASPYFLDTTYGAGASWRLARRLQWVVFAETGTYDYSSLSGGLLDREDEVRSFGSTLNFDLPGGLRLGLQATHRELESGVSGLDSELTQVGLNLQLGQIGWP